MFATILHLMQGTPYIYQGEEIGMVNCRYEIEEYQDVEIRNAYKDLVLDRKVMSKEKFMEAVYRISRDNARTPMQWNSQEHAGFTKGQPWLRVNPRYQEINVENALKDENSIFYYYKKLIQLRHRDPVITDADFRLIDRENKEVFAYERFIDGKSILVIANFGSNPVKFELDKAYKLDSYKLMVSNYKDLDIRDKVVALKPYEALAIKNY